MKALATNVALTVALLVPTALVLAALEFVQTVPNRTSRRVIVIRRVLFVVGILLLVALGVLIAIRFVELRVK